MSIRRLRQMTICLWVAAGLSLVSVIVMGRNGSLPSGAIVHLNGSLGPTSSVRAQGGLPGHFLLWIASGLFGGSLSMALVFSLRYLFDFNREFEESIESSDAVARVRTLSAQRQRALLSSTEYNRRLAEIVRASTSH